MKGRNSTAANALIAATADSADDRAMSLGESIKKAIPWIEPVLDYFDWRKRVVAVFAAIGVAVWSVMKGLPWPAIVTMAFAMLVAMAYALVFPAFLKIVHVGYQPKPKPDIWRHKKKFELYQAAALLADAVPVESDSNMNPDAKAWYDQLIDAVRDREIVRLPGLFDDQHTYDDGYHPYENTIISKDEFRKFCNARGRSPEFLSN